MYPKKLVYSPGGNEYSLEELRANYYQDTNTNIQVCSTGPNG